MKKQFAESERRMNRYKLHNDSDRLVVLHQLLQIFVFFRDY